MAENTATRTSAPLRQSRYSTRPKLINAARTAGIAIQNSPAITYAVQPTLITMPIAAHAGEAPSVRLRRSRRTTWGMTCVNVTA